MVEDIKNGPPIAITTEVEDQEIGIGEMEEMKSSGQTAATVPGKDEAASSKNPQAQLANDPSIEEIRLRAYEIYLGHGSTDGQDLDDWLCAERELVERIHNQHSDLSIKG
jgi:hypothetical protein